MSDTKFTPGPWFANRRYIGVLGHKSFIGECKDVNGNWSDTKTTAANANLIAAAPELYEALEEAVKDLVAYQVNARIASTYNSKWEGVSELVQPTIDSARAALAKARGEKS